MVETSCVERWGPMETMSARYAWSDAKNFFLRFEISYLAQAQCYGRYLTGHAQCKYAPDKKPAIGPLALHQIHLMIFIIAISHITISVGVIVLASCRLHLWRSMAGKERDHLLQWVTNHDWSHSCSRTEITPASIAHNMESEIQVGVMSKNLQNLKDS